jgi:hypothetical protein
MWIWQRKKLNDGYMIKQNQYATGGEHIQYNLAAASKPIIWNHHSLLSI